MSNEIEIWKPVAGLESRFEISCKGRLKSKNGRYKGEKILNPNVDSTGYYCTSLRCEPIHRRARIHVLVAEAFKKDSWFIGACVNHIDGNKLNNNVENLEWVTIGDNIRHAHRTGLVNQNGTNSTQSKIKDEDVLLIRSMSKNNISSYNIKKVLNLPIGDRHIRDIINRVNWKHL